MPMRAPQTQWRTPIQKTLDPRDEPVLPLWSLSAMDLLDLGLGRVVVLLSISGFMLDLKLWLTTIPAWWHCGNAHGQFMQIVWGLFIPTIHAQPHIQLVNQVLWKITATSDNFWENYESKHVYFESKMTRSTLKKMISKDCLSEMPHLIILLNELYEAYDSCGP